MAMLVTICRLYESYPDAERTVEALETAGVPPQDIILVSNNSDNWIDGAGAPAGAADANERRSAEIKRSSATPFAGASSDSSPAVKPSAKTFSAQSSDTTSVRTSPSSDPTEGTVLGAAIGATAGAAGSLIGTLAALAIPGVGPVAGAGWLLALAVAGGAVGGAAGGLLGALTSAGVNDADASIYAEGVRRGGSLVTARVPPEHARRIESVMEPGAVDIRQRAADYRRSGWQTFNPAGAPYSADQVRNERETHRAA